MKILFQFENLLSWFDVPATQMSIFILSVSAGVLFEGAFSLWVSLMEFNKISWNQYSVRIQFLGLKIKQPKLRKIVNQEKQQTGKHFVAW